MSGRVCVVCGRSFEPGVWRHGKRRLRVSGRVTCSDDCADDRRMQVQAGIPLGEKAIVAEMVTFSLDQWRWEVIKVWSRGDWFKYERKLVREKRYPEFEEVLSC